MRPMDRASPFLHTYLIVFFLLHVSHSCPLLQRHLCGANATVPASSARCGDHVVRCYGSAAQIQFYGEGEWCPVQEISYDDRVLLVRDPGVNNRLVHYDCGLVYSFPRRAPPPLPRPVSFQSGLGSDYFIFNCDVGQFNFRKDAFDRAYNSTGCTGFDLYYSYEYEGQEAPANCSGAARFFEWRLRFDESWRNLSVLEAGFSHLRTLRPECFDCRMLGAECSPAGVGNATACSCAKTCSEPSRKVSIVKVKLIIGVVAALIGFLSSWLFILYCCFRKKICWLVQKWKSKNIQNVEDFLEKYGSLIPKRYNYSDVKNMTNHFNKRLGHGGYGKVFKGKLPNGCLVAVKVLHECKGDGDEFVNEVASIGRTYHVNIVRLLGFCSEGTKRALIYEFMPNGSLEKHICSTEPRDLLGWKKLYDIAIGIARGLEYLHHGCNIVHFDIKPHNILLDQDFCPKISDFGLAKFRQPKESILSMAGARGTIGYIAPEVFSRNFGVISSRSDVYSYGMMLLEMVNGSKNVDSSLDNISEVYFPHWVYEQLVHGGSHLEILDVTVETQEVARKMVIVGLWCIQTNPRIRPSMSNVVEMLEGNVEDLRIPPKPHLSSPMTSCGHSCYSESF